MRVQKLMNYDQMMAEYKKECRDYWLKEFPVIGLIGAVIMFGGSYGITKLPGATPSDILPWWAIAFLMWFFATAVWVKMCLPTKPHPDDVLLNRRLRWQHGMDSTVDDTKP